MGTMTLTPQQIAALRISDKLAHMSDDRLEAVHAVLTRMADGWVLERGYFQNPAELTYRDESESVEWPVYLDLAGLVDFFAPCQSGETYEAFGYLLSKPLP